MQPTSLYSVRPSKRTLPLSGDTIQVYRLTDYGTVRPKSLVDYLSIR